MMLTKEEEERSRSWIMHSEEIEFDIHISFFLDIIGKIKFLRRRA